MNNRAQLDGGRERLPNLLVAIVLLSAGMWAIKSGTIPKEMGYVLGVAYVALHTFQVPGLIALGIYDRIRGVSHG